MKLIFQVLAFLAFEVGLDQASKCAIAPIPNGRVKVRKGVVHFSCRSGYVLQGNAKIECDDDHSLMKKDVPRCLRIQRDRPKDYEEYDEYYPEESDNSEYGDYYDYEYEDDDDDSYDDDSSEYNENIYETNDKEDDYYEYKNEDIIGDVEEESYNEDAENHSGNKQGRERICIYNLNDGSRRT